MLSKVFSAKPCLGIHGENDTADLGEVVLHEVPVRRYVSQSCSIWSTDEYGDESCKLFGPALCQSCKNISSSMDLSKSYSIKDEESDDNDMPQDESLQRLKTEEMPGQHSSLELDHDFEGLRESDLDCDDTGDVKVEDVADVHSGVESTMRSYEQRINDTLLYIQKEKARRKLKRQANLDPQFLADKKKKKLMRIQECRKLKRIEKNAESEVRCDTCDEKFTKPSDLRTHNRIAHLKKDYLCQECGSEFYSEKDLGAHKEKLHSQKSTHHYTGPIAAIQEKGGGNIRITSLENAEPEKEYKGELPPFHDNKDWMSMLFPQEYDVTCPICDAKFKHSHFMKLHLRLKHAFDWYQCPICNVWRTQPSELTSHCQEMHANVGLDLECPCCKSSITFLQFQEHTLKCFPLNRSKSGRNTEFSFSRMACRICGEMLFLSRKYYLDHLKSRHGDAIFKCDHEGCGYINVQDEKLIRVHKLRAHGNDSSQKAGPADPVICDFCGNTFRCVGTLRIHCEKEHNTTSEAQAEYPCPECDQTFGTKNKIIHHIKMMHLKLTFACEKCGKPFDGKLGLMQHMMKVHDKEGKRVQCDVCQMWISDKACLKDHARTHTGEKPYTCTFCDKTFTSAAAMTAHRKKRHPDSWAAEKKRRQWLVDNRGKDSTEYRVQCHLCNESRTTIEEVRAHWSEAHPGMTDQTGEYNDEYKKYMSIKRGGDEPFSCDPCGMEFKTMHGLKIHAHHIHSENFPSQFKCTLCKKGFSNAKSLSVHKLKVHDVSDGTVSKLPPSQTKCAVCEICGKAEYASNMKNHMKTHDTTLNRSTKCTYCDKEFSSYVNMTRHRNHHPEWKVDRDAIMQREGSMYAGKEHPSKSTQAKKRRAMKSRETM